MNELLCTGILHCYNVRTRWYILNCTNISIVVVGYEYRVVNVDWSLYRALLLCSDIVSLNSRPISLSVYYCKADISPIGCSLHSL